MSASIIALGDSWGDYPFTDLVEKLESHGYEAENVCRHGSTLDAWAYDEEMGIVLARPFVRLARRGVRPVAILVSAGGNDIAGSELQALLNHARSGLPPLSEATLQATIDCRLRQGLFKLVSGINALSRLYFKEVLPVIVHGYGYPVPDGRGYLGGGWVLPGPWLRPSLLRKGYDDLEQGRQIMRVLIDRFNDMLTRLPEHVGMWNVRYVDLRPALCADEYTHVWSDELHPTGEGFAMAAADVAAVLGRL
jgi:hypothetical protein